MKYLGVIICVFCILLGGCTTNTGTYNKQEVKHGKADISDKEREEAKQVLANYFNALNSNNYNEQLKYLSTAKVKEMEQNRTNWNIVPSYEYIRITNVAPDTSERSRDGYLINGRGQITKPSKLAIFNVDLEYKLKQNNIDQIKDEKVQWLYILIKEKENDTWKIDDWGY